MKNAFKFFSPAACTTLKPTGLRRDSGEAIELLLLPLGSALEFASDTTLNKSAGLLFGIMYLYNREKTTQK